MFFQYLIVVLSILTLLSNLSATPNIIDYDLSEFYSDNKPLMAYESFFGDIIAANSIFQKVDKQKFYNFEYKYDSKKRVIIKTIKDSYSSTIITKLYSYNSSNQISSIEIIKDNFKKIYEFKYDNNNLIKTLKETITFLNEYDNHSQFNYLIYEFDNFGRIFKIYGIKKKFFGFIKDSKILRIYNYYENNRLKFIWNFENPNNTHLLNNTRLVQK